MTNKLLIPNWRESYKFAVQWVQGAGAAITGSWLMLTDEQKLSFLSFLGIPPNMVIAAVAFSIFVAGMFARVANQPALDHTTPTEPESDVK